MTYLRIEICCLCLCAIETIYIIVQIGARGYTPRLSNAKKFNLSSIWCWRCSLCSIRYFKIKMPVCPEITNAQPASNCRQRVLSVFVFKSIDWAWVSILIYGINMSEFEKGVTVSEPDQIYDGRNRDIFFLLCCI